MSAVLKSECCAPRLQAVACSAAASAERFRGVTLTVCKAVNGVFFACRDCLAFVASVLHR